MSQPLAGKLSHRDPSQLGRNGLCWSRMTIRRRQPLSRILPLGRIGLFDYMARGSNFREDRKKIEQSDEADNRSQFRREKPGGLTRTIGRSIRTDGRWGTLSLPRELCLPPRSRLKSAVRSQRAREKPGRLEGVIGRIIRSQRARGKPGRLRGVIGRIIPTDGRWGTLSPQRERGLPPHSRL